MVNKKCLICEVEKPFYEFNKKSDSKDKLYPYCKRCDSLKASQWIKNNREKHNSYKNNYNKKRRTEDDSFRLACNLRSRLRQALLRQVAHKFSKTEELLGISFEEFKEYIEFLMTSEITWDNIELDHVRPLSSFNLTDLEQLKEASHYSNIQPLLKSDNRKKGANYHEHDLMVQNENLYEYEYFKYYK